MFQVDPVAKATITFFITQGIKGALGWFGVKVSGTGSIVALAFAGAVIFFGEAIVASASEPVQTAVNFILMALVAVGGHKTYKGLSPSAKPDAK